MIQATALFALPGLSYVIAVTGNGLKCWLKTDISMNLHFKRVRKKSLQHNGHLPLVLYCTNQSSKSLYALLSPPTDCFLTHLPQHPDKPTLPQNPNMLIRLNLELKINKIKNDLPLSFVNICGCSWNLQIWQMASFLSVYFLFDIFIFKNVWNRVDNITKWKNWHLKWKVLCLQQLLWDLNLLHFIG